MRIEGNATATVLTLASMAVGQNTALNFLPDTINHDQLCFVGGSSGSSATQGIRSVASAGDNLACAIGTNDLKQEYDRLAADFLSNSMFLSSTDAIAGLEEFAGIVGLGPAVLPYILNDLESAPNSWFPVLAAIAGTSPVREQSRGIVAEMISDWRSWGSAHGYR